MLNQYPLWKYLLILVILVVGALYALPNIYGSNPALQITATRNTVVDDTLQQQIINQLEGSSISYENIAIEETGLFVRFRDVEDQLKANELIACTLGSDYTVALNILSAAPNWLEELNALPMYLGLDLRGGLHFLIQVEMEDVVQQAQERFGNDIKSFLRSKKVRTQEIRYLSVVREGNTIAVKFRNAEIRDKAHPLIQKQFSELALRDEEREDASYILASLTEVKSREIKQNAVKQNITTLRNRVNELGVAEPVIQQQGDDRIVVQLPGIQDSARAKEILSATATLEFHMQDLDHQVANALAGRVPLGSRLYDRRGSNQPILLKKRVIVSGENITDAASGFDSTSGTPAVYINLDDVGGRRMIENTKKNLKKPMAVVFIEYKTVFEKKNCSDKDYKIRKQKIEEVINVATIQGVFSRRFQITGLDSSEEAHDLALLLRAGSLAAPISIVEERTIGPSLGQDNIDQGLQSVIIGMLLVITFMVFWYRGFGLVANLALMLNLVLIMAVLSMLQATLTLPGIAGIVLTVGMAVDANVLIFERIREELRNGNTPHSSINAGYSKALGTIADANITTLIAAVVLFIFGTGPIKGFAITLSIGIVTSMFTAIMGTRAVVNLFVSGRKIKTLSV